MYLVYIALYVHVHRDKVHVHVFETNLEKVWLWPKLCKKEILISLLILGDIPLVLSAREIAQKNTFNNLNFFDMQELQQSNYIYF